MSKKVRVAIIGVGNCASSLVQGVQFYKKTPDDATVPGLMHVNLAGYHIKDIVFTLGIDINATKVGKDIAIAVKSGGTSPDGNPSLPSARYGVCTTKCARRFHFQALSSWPRTKGRSLP